MLLFCAHTTSMPQLVLASFIKAVHVPTLGAIAWYRYFHPFVKGKFICDDTIIFLAFYAGKNSLTYAKVRRKVRDRVRKCLQVDCLLPIRSSRGILPSKTLRQGFVFSQRVFFDGRRFVIAKG